MSSRFRALTIIVGLLAPTSAALAENCRAFPVGPERHACAMREHPDKVQAKLEHCRELANDRGGSGPKGGKKEIVQSCMHGKLQ